MNRRQLLAASTTAAAVATTNPPANAGTPRKPALMKAGSQHSVADTDLKAMAAFGVTHVCSTLPSPRFDENWTVQALSRLRERIESHGVKLDMVPLPLSSSGITRAEMPNILLGKSPERDREIEQLSQIIANCAAAGIPAAKYNLTYLNVVSTERTVGRGGASLSTFDYSKAREEPPLTEAGRVTEEQAWERITYFLERIVLVAEQHKVKIACHPHDPAMPKKGFRGVPTVLGSFDGLKRLISIKESPYHGLNFCQGTVSEMLEKPGEQIYDIIRYFGERKKIFNVHFRNIKGGYLKFQETFPDDGDVDMIRAMRVYRDVGYDGMIMPDHVPVIPGVASSREQGFAFAFGYIQALIQLVGRE